MNKSIKDIKSFARHEGQENLESYNFEINMKSSIRQAYVQMVKDLEGFNLYKLNAILNKYRLELIHVERKITNAEESRQFTNGFKESIEAQYLIRSLNHEKSVYLKIISDLDKLKDE